LHSLPAPSPRRTSLAAFADCYSREAIEEAELKPTQPLVTKPDKLFFVRWLRKQTRRCGVASQVQQRQVPTRLCEPLGLSPYWEKRAAWVRANYVVPGNFDTDVELFTQVLRNLDPEDDDVRWFRYESGYEAKTDIPNASLRLIAAQEAGLLKPRTDQSKDSWMWQCLLKLDPKYDRIADSIMSFLQDRELVPIRFLLPVHRALSERWGWFTFVASSPLVSFRTTQRVAAAIHLLRRLYAEFRRLTPLAIINRIQAGDFDVEEPLSQKTYDELSNGTKKCLRLIEGDASIQLIAPQLALLNDFIFFETRAWLGQAPMAFASPVRGTLPKQRLIKLTKEKWPQLVGLLTFSSEKPNKKNLKYRQAKHLYKPLDNLIGLESLYIERQPLRKNYDKNHAVWWAQDDSDEFLHVAWMRSRSMTLVFFIEAALVYSEGEFDEATEKAQPMRCLGLQEWAWEPPCTDAKRWIKAWEANLATRPTLLALCKNPAIENRKQLRLL
jgi:hypothetical protein